MNGRRLRPHEKIQTWQSGLNGVAKRGRERVGVETRTEAFERLVWSDPENFEILIEGECEDVNAHEAAIFLADGVQTGDDEFDGRPVLIFTTQPYCSKKDRYYCVDIKGLCLETRRLKVLHTSRNLANGGCLGRDGRLYFCFQGAKVEAKDLSEEMLHHPAGISSVDPKDWDDWRIVVDGWGPDGRPFNSPNDVVMSASSGSLFFTDPSYAAQQGYAPPAALGDWVWRYDFSDKSVSVIADNFSRPNGVAFSPDEKTFYVTDTGYVVGDGTVDPSKPRSIYAFDVVTKLSVSSTTKQILTNRCLLYVADNGVPDGIKVDQNGFIYTGCADGVHVIDPNTGCLLGKIIIKGNDGGAANLSFGAPGSKYQNTLFILAEAAIIAVHLKTQGPVSCRPP